MGYCFYLSAITLRATQIAPVHTARMHSYIQSGFFTALVFFTGLGLLLARLCSHYLRYCYLMFNPTHNGENMFELWRKCGDQRLYTPINLPSGVAEKRTQPMREKC
jgi:hypothetical protein